MRLTKIGDRYHMVGTRFFCGTSGAHTEIRDSAETPWEERCRNCDGKARVKGRIARLGAREHALRDPTIYRPRFTLRHFDR